MATWDASPPSVHCENAILGSDHLDPVKVPIEVGRPYVKYMLDPSCNSLRERL